MEKDTNYVYVSSVHTVHACSDTGEVHFGCIINGADYQVTMDLYEAIHMVDKEYLKKCLIKYIKNQ